LEVRAGLLIETKPYEAKQLSETFLDFTNGGLVSRKLPNPGSDHFSDKKKCVK
jgi:hypothetical protein